MYHYFHDMALKLQKHKKRRQESDIKLKVGANYSSSESSK